MHRSEAPSGNLADYVAWKRGGLPQQKPSEPIVKPSPLLEMHQELFDRFRVRELLQEAKATLDVRDVPSPTRQKDGYELKNIHPRAGIASVQLYIKHREPRPSSISYSGSGPEQRTEHSGGGYDEWSKTVEREIEVVVSNIMRVVVVPTKSEGGQEGNPQLEYRLITHNYEFGPRPSSSGEDKIPVNEEETVNLKLIQPDQDPDELRKVIGDDVAMLL